jgi:hypothetical protein
VKSIIQHFRKVVQDCIYKLPGICVATISSCLTNFTVLLPQSHDCSCNVSSRLLESRPLRIQKHNDVGTHNFARSPDLDISLGSLTLTALDAGDFVELMQLWLCNAYFFLRSVIHTDYKPDTLAIA